MEKPKVVILCGGEGTRLREETEYKPKPMVTVGGMPILWHIMKYYSHFGFNEFVLCLGYRGDMIKQFFLMHELMSNDVTIQLGRREMDVVHKNKNLDDWTITFAETGIKAQTGTRIKRAEKYIGSDWFLSTYGDGLSDTNLHEEIEFHKRHGLTGTIAAVHPHSKFGLIEAEASGIINRFTEKPVLYDYVNGGFHVFQKEIFDFMSSDDNCILEVDVFSKLVEKRKLAMFKHDGFWHAMDTYKDYLELNGMWDEGVRPWKIWSD